MDYTEINDSVDLTSVYKRDPAYIKSIIKKTKDGRFVSDQALEIHFPSSYEEKHLAKMESYLECLGIFAIVDPKKNKYAVFNIPAMVRLSIPEMREYTYHEDKYKVLKFQPFDDIIIMDKIEQNDKLAYWIYDYYIALGRVPWYMSYSDVLKIPDQDHQYANEKILANSFQITDMIYSNIARNPNNNKQMYRYVLKKPEDEYFVHPEWVPLRNITLGSVDTLSKIMGAYYDDGLTSALAEPSKKLTTVERVLRS